MYPSQERVQQISELTAQVPGCRPLNRDQSLFEVPVRMRDGRITNLRVSLPPNFPAGRPGLAPAPHASAQVTQPLRHPWVDSAGRLSWPALDAWSGRSRLAALVAEATSSLSGTPARADATPSPSRPGSDTGSRPPGVPQEFPELAAMSAEQLSNLLASEEAYTAFVQKQAANAHIIQVKSALRRGNGDLARATLAKEALLGELRNQIAIIRSSEYAAAKEAFDEKYERQQAVLSQLQPSVLIDALAKAAAAADADSDKVYERFLKGELSVDAFLTPYVAARTLYHQRELKRQAAQQTL